MSSDTAPEMNVREGRLMTLLASIENARLRILASADQESLGRASIVFEEIAKIVHARDSYEAVRAARREPLGLIDLATEYSIAYAAFCNHLRPAAQTLEQRVQFDIEDARLSRASASAYTAYHAALDAAERERV